MTGSILLYGATGFTGKLIAREARARQASVVLAGRNPNRLKAVAKPLDLNWRAFDLADRGRLGAALKDVAVVLNAAGPFSATARPIADACLASGAHYLDITGEIDVFEGAVRSRRRSEAGRRDADARRRLRRGSQRLPRRASQAPASRRDPPDALSFRRLQRFPRDDEDGDRRDRQRRAGAPERAARHAGPAGHGLVRLREGLEADDPDPLGRCLDRLPFDRHSEHRSPRRGPAGAPGPRLDPGVRAVASGASARAAFVEGPGRRSARRPQRRGPAQAAVHPGGEFARNAKGEAVRTRLTTPEGYTLTARTSLDAALRVAAGEFKPGFQTPSMAFGPDYIMGFEGVMREELNA